MARRVFFSFHYENDISRSMVVRNNWVTQGKESAGFIDKAEFEKMERQGERVIYNWIDRQLEGTSVTVVLIGSETLERKFVQYEIYKSWERGNAIIGVYIHSIRDFNSNTSRKGDVCTVIGKYNNNPICFNEICCGIYDYVAQDGYNNMGIWIENAARTRNK
ncbi:MAG: TIR domain-containing protein [Helicobacter sp.]|nr:TIR domain-containing protein [Helicobacter sp.]